MDLIEQKKLMKKKKPVFTRQDNHKKSLASGWRRPKGLHSKMRHQFKGYKRIVKIGYGTPAALRHTHQGKPIVRITSVEQAKQAKGIVAIIAAGIGGKKKLEILELLKKNNTPLLHDTISAVEQRITQRRKTTEKKKTETKAPAPVKKTAKKKKTETTDADQKEEKLKEKQELDKALIHTT